jgi:NADH:ubiquinone oxidoreductase subunit K
MEPSAKTWSPMRRIVFRFVFSYLVLYNFPFPLDSIPWLGPILTQPYTDLWNALVPWVGKHLFHVTITVRPNGSGDTTYNYVQVFCYLVIALAAAAVWTLLGAFWVKKRTQRLDYDRLSEGLRTYVRFALGLTMISYGASKVIPAQFPQPGLDQLVQTFGEASPMGILWTFMGASPSYVVFSGLAEMVGGLLLMVRRTALLGALVCIGVMVNVVMLNFSYDVPVKLYSSHLLAMAFFLLLPDLRRLTNVFLLNRPAEPITPHPPLTTGWLRRAAPFLVAVLAVAYTGYALYGSYDGSKQYGNRAPKPPLYGVWNVDELEVDGVARPPLLTDATRWRRLVVSYPGVIGVQLMDSTSAYYRLYLGKRRLALAKFDDPQWKPSFSYREIAPGLLALEGTLDGKRTRIKMRRVPDAAFTLTNRGFHWINESPFNH